MVDRGPERAGGVDAHDGARRAAGATNSPRRRAAGRGARQAPTGPDVRPIRPAATRRSATADVAPRGSPRTQSAPAPGPPTLGAMPRTPLVAPPALGPGARVALVAPAGPLSEADLARAVANARSFGWEPIAALGLLAVTQVALNADWSALRFRYRDEIKQLLRRSEQAQR